MLRDGSFVCLPGLHPYRVVYDVPNDFPLLEPLANRAGLRIEQGTPSQRVRRAVSDKAPGRWPVRPEIAIPVAWAAATVAALLVTLPSLKHDNFDGLNNIYQIPLALPWFLIPIGGSSRTTRTPGSSLVWVSSMQCCCTSGCVGSEPQVANRGAVAARLVALRVGHCALVLVVSVAALTGCADDDEEGRSQAAKIEVFGRPVERETFELLKDAVPPGRRPLLDACLDERRE